MLHLIPAPLHRVLYRLADRVRRTWRRLRKPHLRSAQVLAFDDRGRVLLVRHSYGPAVWAVPGGGIGRHEAPAAAAAREIGEELGCEVAELVPLGPQVIEGRSARDEQHVFTARLASEPVPDQREIVAARWFDPADLPANATRHAAALVQRALQARGGTESERLQQR